MLRNDLINGVSAAPRSTVMIALRGKKWAVEVDLSGSGPLFSAVWRSLGRPLVLNAIEAFFGPGTGCRRKPA